MLSPWETAGGATALLKGGGCRKAGDLHIVTTLDPRVQFKQS